MEVLNVSLDNFIRLYAKKENTCYNYKKYPKEIQIILEKIFNACDRFLLRKTQILFILDETLQSFNNIDLYAENEKLKEKVKNDDKIIGNLYKQVTALENRISKLKESATLDCNLKMNMMNISKYLGVSRQTIYNLKEKGRKK